jgi:hypothetical protein
MAPGRVGFIGSPPHRGVRPIAIDQSDIRSRNWVACTFREPGRGDGVPGDGSKSSYLDLERSLETGEIHITDHAHLEQMK